MGFKPYLKDQLVSFSALTLLVWSYKNAWIGFTRCGKNRPRNDLYCVEWDVKPLHYYMYYMGADMMVPWG